MSRRRRLTIGVCASLALGALTAISIACAGALIGQTRDWMAGEWVALVAPDGQTALSIRAARQSPTIQVIFITISRVIRLDPDYAVIRDRNRDLTLRRVSASPFHIHPMPAKADESAEYHIGWPVPCLWGASNSDSSVGGDAINTVPPTHIARVWPPGPLPTGRGYEAFWYFFPKDQTVCRFLPTGILPAGLAIDTLAFAPAWVVLIFLPGLLFRDLRRYLRRRRGHCPRCNYDRRGLAPNSPCPECGFTPRVKLPA